MKIIGVLGGSSDQATADYYRRLNAAANARLGGINTAEVLISSMNFRRASEAIRGGRWDEMGAYLADHARALEAAGAQILLCVSNSLHRLAPVFTRGLTIPFLHIVDPTAAAINARGFQRAAFVGTKAAMTDAVLHGRYAEKFGIALTVPPASELDELDRIIFDELCAGQCRPESKRLVLEVAARMHREGAECFILGCTELPLLVGQADLPQLPMFDTAGLHVEAAVDYALRGPMTG